MPRATLTQNRATVSALLESLCGDVDTLLEAYAAVLTPLTQARLCRALDALEAVCVALDEEGLPHE
jgi:hypothetical protein